ncbi:hypothetical protein [Tychonema sp. LEGE 06208]|uniref:hypothetical protein n=1 Tax=Tychonema sp. LEGE 06208 TaxID=1828663 RepID=UPI001D132890|nr:hypothetical protein [Tychonema sp. LEGE 06208]
MIFSVLLSKDRQTGAVGNGRLFPHFFWEARSLAKEEGIRRKKKEGSSATDYVTDVTDYVTDVSPSEEGRGKKASEGRGKREEGRGKKEEGRRKREDTRRHPKLEARS